MNGSPVPRLLDDKKNCISVHNGWPLHLQELNPAHVSLQITTLDVRQTLSDKISTSCIHLKIFQFLVYLTATVFRTYSLDSGWHVNNWLIYCYVPHTHNNIYEENKLNDKWMSRKMDVIININTTATMMSRSAFTHPTGAARLFRRSFHQPVCTRHRKVIEYTDTDTNTDTDTDTEMERREHRQHRHRHRHDTDRDRDRDTDTTNSSPACFLFSQSQPSILCRFVPVGFVSVGFVPVYQ